MATGTSLPPLAPPSRGTAGASSALPLLPLPATSAQLPGTEVAGPPRAFQAASLPSPQQPYFPSTSLLGPAATGPPPPRSPELHNDALRESRPGTGLSLMRSSSASDQGGPSGQHALGTLGPSAASTGRGRGGGLSSTTYSYSYGYSSYGAAVDNNSSLLTSDRPNTGQNTSTDVEGWLHNTGTATTSTGRHPPPRPQQHATPLIVAEEPPAETVVLTPTRVRVDSRVVLLHCTSNWISNALLAFFILLKLERSVDWSWWFVFAPTWVHHCVSIYLQATVLYFRNTLVEKHIGPPPPDTSSPTLRLQYNILRKMRVKSHTVDAVNSLIDSVSLFIVKVLLCYQLSACPVSAVAVAAPQWWSFRLVFLPFWISWVATTMLTFLKDKQERVFGSARDLQYMFFLFVACKLDGRGVYSWRIVFLVPWLWFAAIFLLAALVGTLLLLARFWRRFAELLLPFGFLALLLACTPQFASYLALVRMLDQLDETGHTDVSLRVVLLPNAASWLLMWSASLLLAIGLRQKEYVRERLLASGQVWTANDRLATHVNTDAVESTQRQIDLMSDDEVALLVEEMMRGKTKPSVVMRVGESLYRILAGAESEGTAVAPFPSADGSQGALAQQGGSKDAEQRAGKREVELTMQDELSAMENGTPSDHDTIAVPGVVPDTSDPCASLQAESSEYPSGQVHPLPPEGNAQVAVALPPQRGTSSHVALDDDDDLSCIICCDAPPTCVFLSCGHGGVCRKCANKLFVRPPNECPTCRQRIEQVVELEAASTRIGDILRVI